MRLLSRLLAAFAAPLLVAGCVEGTATPPMASGGGTDNQVLATAALPDGQRGQVSPANPRIHYVGGDGSTMAKAVVIKGAKGEIDGVQSEYDWLARNLPGWQPGDQALLTKGNRYYDLLTLRKAGAEREVFFDITDYFGKF